MPDIKQEAFVVISKGVHMLIIDEMEMLNQEWSAAYFDDIDEEIDDFTTQQIAELRYVALNPRLKVKVIHQVLRISNNLKGFCAQKKRLIENLPFLREINEDIDLKQVKELLK